MLPHLIDILGQMRKSVSPKYLPWPGCTLGRGQTSVALDQPQVPLDQPQVL